MNDNTDDDIDRKAIRRDKLANKRSRRDFDDYQAAQKHFQKEFKREKRRMIEQDTDEDMEQYRFKN